MSSLEQKNKNRFRLLYLLVLYPIYQTIRYFIDDNYTWAVIFLGISILYVLMLILIWYKMRNQNNR
ncbi:hypothetical protein DSAG12_04485 [Promethearchaeum syntrophicum]|uniref:Uncharacterized protein n=1 Tax=Promethearchaeum syntrophicum TaxID=2594042 RepID=A0AC61ZU45_9ARCH